MLPQLIVIVFKVLYVCGSHVKYISILISEIGGNE